MMYAIGYRKECPMKPSQQIQRIKRRIADIGPFLPGSISEQWNVCGKDGCACKDPHKPQKHGPYYQLSFSVKGRSSTMFLKGEYVVEARRRVQRNKDFKELCFALTQAYVDLAREEGLRRGRA